MSQTRPIIAYVILIAVAALNGCTQEEAAERSMLRIDTVKTVIYIKKPEGCTPNRECTLFKVDSDERYATQVSVQLGEVVGNLVQVMSGLQSGDRVILSDM